jgi:hypothetical protein
MSASPPLVHPPASAPDVTSVNNPNRPAKLTRPAATAQATIQHKPAKKVRNRIPSVQRLRVMQRYASGENQTAIARQEGINRETVGRIVKSAEMDAFTEEIRGRWRGLCDAAVESVRRLIAKDDRQTVLRVLESNGVIPPEGTTLNHIQTAPKPTGDERVKNLRVAFADVMLERAKAFKTPFPELAQIAEQHNIEVGLDLRGASDEAEEDEI